MEVLITLAVLVLLGLVFAGVAGGGLFAWGERSRRRAEERAPQILDAAFDGRRDVVFKVNLESPSYETVILGARQRGYRLTSETTDSPSGEAKTLIFRKARKKAADPGP